MEDRNIFTRKLDDPLDMSHPEAERLGKNEEDHDFLVAQKRPGRQGYISGADESWCRKKAAQNKKLEQEDRRRRRAAGMSCWVFGWARDIPRRSTRSREIPR